ncbi:MAG TPA: VIT1/CCC1 transporter family protein [Solirubrobacteraceae bacterium]|nr:VIT1/CCC1 transporter family protein [Solirubrobacteraceae bacterium]
MTRRPAHTRAARAHTAGRVDALASDHTPPAVRRRLGRRPSPSYLHDFIYGAVDGAITTFAVVAGVAGANLDETVVIILGGANLLADGFSMAASNFLGSRADRQRRDRALREEELHIELVPEGEREEIRQIYAAKGFAGDDLERVVEVITADRELWARTMMSEELGFSATQPNEYRAALSTLLAFLTVGFLPLLVYVYDVAAPGEIHEPFVWSAILTGVAFLAVGGMKSRFVDQSWWRSATETLVVGGLAAALAYGAGAALQGVA